MTEGGRSISWSWEVERPGTPLTGGMPFRQHVYWATFEVDADGVMRVSARMVSPTGQFRAPEWTLKSKFKEALEVFRRGGVEVRAFEAEWGYVGPGEISHNLDAFLKHLSEHPGMQLEAARATPSGKVALENGFTEVQVVAEPGYEPSEVPGHTGLSESRPVVRVRFAVRGSPAPTGARPSAPTAATVPPVERPPLPVRRIPAGVKVAIGWGLQVALFAFFWWAGHERAKQQEKLLKELQASKIDPAIDAALVTRADEAYRIRDAAPTLPMYANVTIDFRSVWQESGIAGERVGERIVDANFVSLGFGSTPIQSESTGSKECDSFFISQNSSCSQVTRVTSPILVFHPDHEEYKRQQYEAWEPWVKEHPEWSFNPPHDQAVKPSQNYYWVHQRRGIQTWLQDLARRQLEDELGLSKKREPSVTVIR